MEYGYARVSTKEQNEDRQINALTDYGLSQRNIYTDKESGKDFNRESYRKLCRRLRAGDVFVVKSIDRLGRNYSEILEQWRFITKKKGCSIVVIDMPLLNTEMEKDLTGIVISDIILQLLSYVAEIERSFNRQRQAEGIAAARERGVRFGRKPKETPEGFAETRMSYEAGEINSREAGALLGVSHVTFLKWIRNQ